MAEKKIGGVTYRTEPLLARDALELMAKLIKVGGAGWEKLKAALGEDVQRKDVDVKLVAIDALIDVVRHNPTPDVLDLIEEIVGLAQRHAPSGAYDPCDMNSFTGRMNELFELLAWIVEEQFGGFFDAPSRNGARKARAA